MALADQGLLESHFTGRLTIGTRSFECDGVAGGGINVNVQKTVLGSDGAMSATQAGRKDYDDVTFSIKVRKSQGVEVERYLLQQAGQVATIVRYATDGQFSPTGSPMTYTGGVLTKVDPPSYDNESTTVAKVGGTVIGAILQ